MNRSERDAKYHELTFYTLGHPDMAYFIHQHVVDAYTAQNADENTKPIAITFALAGLYLYVEKNYSGGKVQQAHVVMSKNKKRWPTFPLPAERGEISIAEVMNASPGEERDIMIRKWCETVWKSFGDSHEIVAAIVKTCLSSRLNSNSSGWL